MNFRKFTRTDRKGKIWPIIINLDNVISITRQPAEAQGSIINFIDKNDQTFVNESLEDIEEKLKSGLLL